MAASLNDFISQIKKDGLARQNRFTVTIGNLSLGNNKVTIDGKIVTLFCEQALLPSLSLSSQGVKSYGESREVVYDRNFESITLTFLVDKNMEVKKYFDMWIDTIISPNTRNASYYDTYCKDITILVQDTKDNNVYETVLREAYPKTIGAISLDYNNKDIMKLQVTFNYKYHNNAQLSTSRGEPNIKSQFGFDLPDPYKLSRKLGDYLRGSVANSLSQSDLYFSNFSEYQQQLNDRLAITNSIERQGFTTGTGPFTLG
jgi:hypothetical protein